MAAILKIEKSQYLAVDTEPRCTCWSYL